MQVNHLLLEGLSRQQQQHNQQQQSQHVSNSSSSSSNTSSSIPHNHTQATANNMYGRPLSLGSLLSSHRQTRSSSIASRKSMENVGGAIVGEEPISSSTMSSIGASDDNHNNSNNITYDDNGSVNVNPQQSPHPLSSIVSPTSSIFSLAESLESRSNHHHSAGVGINIKNHHQQHQQRNLVVLPLNEHGVRTRIKILPSSSHSSSSTKTSPTIPTTSALGLAGPSIGSSGGGAAVIRLPTGQSSSTSHQHTDTNTNTNTNTTTNANTTRPRSTHAASLLSLANAPMASIATPISSSILQNVNHRTLSGGGGGSSNNNSSVTTSTSISTSMNNNISSTSNARRVASESMARMGLQQQRAPQHNRDSRSGSPASFLPTATTGEHHATSSSYKFPPKQLSDDGVYDSNRTYTYGQRQVDHSKSDSASMLGLGRPSSHSHSHTSSSLSSSSTAATASGLNGASFFTSPTTNNDSASSAFSTPPPAASLSSYGNSAHSKDDDRAYSNSSSDNNNKAVAIPSTRAAHLANLPKSLIPGGYDFSPASTSTHDTHATTTSNTSMMMTTRTQSPLNQYSKDNSSSPSGQHARTASSSAFAFMRDRSASVPRTVSSFGDNDRDDDGEGSERDTLDRQQYSTSMTTREPVPDIDASFQTAKQTLESSNTTTTITTAEDEAVAANNTNNTGSVSGSGNSISHRLFLQQQQQAKQQWRMPHNRQMSEQQLQQLLHTRGLHSISSSSGSSSSSSHAFSSRESLDESLAHQRQHSRLASASGIGRDSIDENGSSEDDVEPPLISPIPPKLDLDFGFGSSSSFTLDFGNEFSSSSVGGGFGLGLSFGDFGMSSFSSSNNNNTTSKVVAPQSKTDTTGLNDSGFGSGGGTGGLSFLPEAKIITRSADLIGAGADLDKVIERQYTREKNDSTATTTQSSFLSLQPPPSSSQNPNNRHSLSNTTDTYEAPQLSSTSVSTLMPSTSSRSAPTHAHGDDISVAERAVKSPLDDDKPLATFLNLQPSVKGSSDDHTPKVSPTGTGKSNGNEISQQQQHAIAEIVASQNHSRSDSRAQTARSDSPASQPSSTSLSRPVSSLSSLFMTHMPTSANSANRNSKRITIDDLTYPGDYTGSDDSRRTTLSSGEQLPHLKTSHSSSNANLSSNGSHQNVRLSMNKSLPPVPPGGDPGNITSTYSPNSAGNKQVRPGTGSSQGSSFDRSRLSTGSREQLGPHTRRSYSEQVTSRHSDERRLSSNSRHKQADSFSSSQGDFKTPQFAKVLEESAGRPRSRTSAADTLSLDSSSTTGYNSMDVTRNFTSSSSSNQQRISQTDQHYQPPQVTRVYRSGSESESLNWSVPPVDIDSSRNDLNQKLTERGFEKDRLMKQAVPMATLARPKLNAQNSWPNGELRKRDATTEKLLLTVASKLEAWVQRHEDRLMTPEEAKWHNRPSSRLSQEALQQLQAEHAASQRSSRLPLPRSLSSDVKAPTLALPASLESDISFGSRELSFEVQSATTATTTLAKAVPIKSQISPASSVEQVHLRVVNGSLASTATVQSPAVGPNSSENPLDRHIRPPPPSDLKIPPKAASLSVSASSNSISTLSKASDKSPSTSPSTALQLSPSADSTLVSTAPLKVLSRSKTGTLVSRQKKAMPPGGEQPWSQTWIAITEALISYKSAVKQQKQDRATFCQTGLLQNFKDEELAALLRNRNLSQKQRELLLDWIDVLFEDLQGTPPNRGACLDGVAAIVESRLMNFFAFNGDTKGAVRLEQTIAKLLAFAIDKLNGKAIFANTLGFAGKMLAAAFWNLDGVALKLLRLLPAVKRQHVLRIVSEIGIAEYPGKFPAHLDPLAFNGNVTDYMKLFPPVRTGSQADTFLYMTSLDGAAPKRSPTVPTTDAKETPDPAVQEIKIEMAGNWLIRWTATDSDLPFAFMRAYHRQLSNYLALYQVEFTEPLSSAQLIRAPGYAFVSATLLEVCDALIHRNLRSVTTMAPSNTGVNANESANLAAGQKPKALEVVSKRVIQTIFEVVGGALQAGSPSSTPAAFTSAAMRHNFGASLNMWIKAVTKRTSMWDTRGIFALLDLIEGLVYNVCSPPFEEGIDDDEEIWVPSEVGLVMFDTKFVLSFIKTILSKADNTTCLLRTISFLYTEFQTFTFRPEDREELCDRILLDAVIFERLFLYYNVGVRGYFLRLLVYRLARLGSSDDGKPITKDSRVFSTLRLFEHRLEKIRKRHDEIDPLDEWDSDSSDDFRPRPKRSTISSTWGVHNKPWILSPGGRSSESSEDDPPRETVQKGKVLLQDIQEDMPDVPSIVPSPNTQLAYDEEIRLQRRRAEQHLSANMSGGLYNNLPPIPVSPNASGANGKKVNVAKSAKKVWNALTNRKASGPIGMGKSRQVLQEHISPYYEGVPAERSADNVTLVGAHTAPFETTDARLGRSRASTITHIVDTAASEKISEEASLDKALASGTQKSNSSDSESSIVAQGTLHEATINMESSPSKADFLTIDIPAPRLRKQSSRKSIRRAAAQQAHGVVSSKNGHSAAASRSRRSSMYSFDLDVETPRSDSFDLPRSPLMTSANGIVHSNTAPVSPASGANGVLSLSPVAFGALMDGALSFNMDGDENGGDRASGRLTPGSGHRRHKSGSSLKGRSRPVSVASDRTGPSPRVSKRFSKRASILPQPAFDLLKESPSEPVPKIPEQYKTPTSGTGKSFMGSSAIPSANRPPSPEPYSQKLHPYAIRGLREYEDCLDEWELFQHRVKEEEGVDGRELAALIPRLQCAWPSTWEE